jgi:hypothetical protein
MLGNDKHEKPGIDSKKQKNHHKITFTFSNFPISEFGQQKCGFRLPGTLARNCRSGKSQSGTDREIWDFKIGKESRLES